MNESDITLQQIMYGDTLSFFNFTHKQLKRGLDPDWSVCNSSVYFGGPNNVIIRTAIYATRSFPTSIKLLLVDRLNSNEIIQRSPSCLYIHVVSASRLDKVFEMGDRSPMHAFNIKDESRDILYRGCSKITLKWLAGGSTSGNTKAYVIDQVERGRGENKRNRWVLQLLNNELIEINAPTFNRNSYKYEFEAEGYYITGGKRFEVTQFYPIRFVIGRKLSTIRFIMHRLALDTTAEGRLIKHLCT